MEQKIKRVVKQLVWSYYIFWILPIAILIMGECNCCFVGSLVENSKVSYLLETAVILVTAISVPLSLKLFSWVLRRKIDQMTITSALSYYFKWNIIRLLLLFLPLVFNFVTYYLTLNNRGLLCGLIILTASFFCIPSEEKLRSELKIDKEL